MKNYQNKAKIFRVSKILRVVLSVGLFLWAFAGICIFTGIVIPILILPAVRAGLQLDPQKTYWLCNMLLCASLGFVVNLKLFRFFSRLKDGHLFDAQTIEHLESAGRWLIALGFFQALFAIIEGWVTHSQNITFSGEGIFSGWVLIFTAWLFREGQEL